MDVVEKCSFGLPAAIAAAREAMPGVHADEVTFSDSVRKRLANVDAEGDLSTLRIDDLWLAFACAEGDEQALLRLAAIVEGLATDARPRFPRLPETWDDVTQRFMRLLLVGEGRPPKIMDYAGTGELRAWLRVALTRFLLNVAQREGRERPEDLPFFAALADGGSSAEAEYLRAACLAELRASLETSASALTPRERALLRFSYADGKTVHEVGAVYGVHGATASRWIQKARERLASLVRDDLVKRLELSDSEASSMLRGALSQIDVTLNRLLAG
jgi:RNA polymerase sigma-70 factor (ECF subfamily)